MPTGHDESSQPLLSSSYNPSVSAGTTRDAVEPSNSRSTNPTEINPDDTSAFKSRKGLTKYRKYIQDFLASRAQHFCVLGLVSLDLLGIFADIFINLYTCEEGEPSPTWNKVRNGLGIAGLVFSCLFMLELILSVWAFGWRNMSFLNHKSRYFTSWFHIFDAIVIIAGFIVDVLLHGILEEVASLVIVLRLWRFFKIVEEFSVGAQEQMDGLELRIESLEVENRDLKDKLRKMKRGDEESEVGIRRD